MLGARPGPYLTNSIFYVSIKVIPAKADSVKNLFWVSFLKNFDNARIDLLWSSRQHIESMFQKLLLRISDNYAVCPRVLGVGSKIREVRDKLITRIKPKYLHLNPAVRQSYLLLEKRTIAFRRVAPHQICYCSIYFVGSPSQNMKSAYIRAL